MIATKSGVRAIKSPTKVPDYLVYEVLNAKSIHYFGYQEVLKGEKTLSEIMGSSALQSLIITHLVILIGKLLDDNKFTVLTNEAGIHLDNKNNLAGDILIVDNEKLPVSAMNENYIQVPPKIVIEVDIIADPSDITPDNYIYQKTQKLLDFGVEKVIWITTQSKKITIATAEQDWQVKDWHKEVEVMEGIKFNIGQFLVSKGSGYA